MKIFGDFCSDLQISCGKLGKITVFEGELTAENEGFVGFWGLNGDFFYFWVIFGCIFCFGVGMGLKKRRFFEGNEEKSSEMKINDGKWC